jgi:hypothetical protein
VTRRAKVHAAPIAITSSGNLLVNVAMFDDVTTLDEILRQAKKEKSPVFIGVTLQTKEMPLVAARVHDACREAAAFIAGGRRQQRRRAGRARKK